MDTVFQILINALILAGVWISYRVEVKKMNSKVNSAETERKEVLRKHLSSSFEIDFNDLNEIKNIIHEVITKSSITRVLMLSSVNGKDPVNWISVLWEQHGDGDLSNLSLGATSKYMDISSDHEYRDMLHQIEKGRPYIVEVDKMDPCMLRDIYQSEKIKHSMVVFGYRAKITNMDDQLIYFSWATHNDQPFAPAQKLEIMSATNRIIRILKKAKQTDS